MERISGFASHTGIYEGSMGTQHGQQYWKWLWDGLKASGIEC